jgi:RTC4-like domain
MFPEKTLEPYDLSPLGWNEIIFEFLLPEVAILLIQDDLRVSREDAIDTLHHSRVFGTLMHPLEDESTVVEDLVWEQARRHRIDTPVKVEQRDVSMAWKVNREVIDLTLDDD